MAQGFQSAVRMTLTPLDPDGSDERQAIVWAVSMRDGPLKSDPQGFDHEIAVSVTRIGTGEKIEVEIDGNASTWETFRLLAESGLPEFVDLFGGQRALMID